MKLCDSGKLPYSFIFPSFLLFLFFSSPILSCLEGERKGRKEKRKKERKKINVIELFSTGGLPDYHVFPSFFFYFPSSFPSSVFLIRKEEEREEKEG